MKIKHLGKILILLLVTTISIFATNVEASLDKSQIFSGDMAKLNITAKGKSVEFPDIKEIEGFPVVNQSTSTKVVYINGNLTQTKTKSYYFEPTKSIIIPSYEVKVDGNSYHTNELKLNVVKQVASQNGQNIVLELNTTKSRAKVGEPIELLLKFKIKRGTRVSKVNIVPPKLENFWVEQIKGEQKSIEGDYEVVTYIFLITPQKSGKLKIPATFVEIGRAVKTNRGFNDPFFDDPFFNNSMFNQIKWQKVYSNSLSLDVESLPDNLELYGHFLITANVDKRVVNANEPVNLTIKVEGEGNLDDIQKFNLQIPNTMVYNNEPKVHKKIVNGKTVGVFLQKIAIVADRNYTIPPLELKYFDSQLQKPVTIKTNPIEISVKGSPVAVSSTTPTKAKVEVAETKNSNQDTKPEQTSQSSSADSTLNYLYLLLSFIAGILITFVATKLINKKPKKSQKPITVEIKKAKDDKTLYKLLLPYTKDDYVKRVVEKLEENIYKNSKNKIDKNELTDYFEEILNYN